MARRYFRQAIADPAAYETKLDMTRAHLKPTMRLFEFGCGTGSTALLHAPLVKHIDALDVSPKMIDIAREQAAEKKITNVDFHVGAIQDWPQQGVPRESNAHESNARESGPYDMVLGLSILHLLADRQAVLRQVHAQLTDGGLFVSSTSCIADMGGLVPRLLPIATRLGLVPILRIFTADELIADMERAGFEIIETFRPGPDQAIFLICRKA